MQTGDGQPQNQHNQPPPHNASNSSIDNLVKWFKSNSTHNPVKREEKQIIQGSEHYWQDHGFKLAGRENFILWQQAILQDTEYIDACDLLEQGAQETNDPIKKAGLATKNQLLETQILSMLLLNISSRYIQIRSSHPTFYGRD